MFRFKIPFRKSDNVIDNGSTVRIVGLRASEEPVIDPLGDDDVGELNVAKTRALEGLLDSHDLGFNNVRDLTVTDSIPGWKRLLI